MDEQELIQKAQLGNADAMGRLYRMHVAHVYRFVYAKIGKRRQAEDITSDVFLSVLEHIHTYNGRSAFRTWVFGIARYKILDYLREKYKAVFVPILEHLVWHTEQQGEEEHNNTEQLVHDMISSLPEKYRTVLSLRFLSSYSTKEIAEELGLTVANVKVIQHRAIKQLQKQYESQYAKNN